MQHALLQPGAVHTLKWLLTRTDADCHEREQTMSSLTPTHAYYRYGPVTYTESVGVCGHARAQRTSTNLRRLRGARSGSSVCVAAATASASPPPPPTRARLLA